MMTAPNASAGPDAGNFALSFVVPTFRETEAGLGRSLDVLLSFLSARDRGRAEILIVDDSDEPLHQRLREMVDERRGSGPPSSIELRPLMLGPRRGKGAAVRLAALASRGDIVFVIDADLPVPLPFVDVFLDTMSQTGADLVIGQRPADRYRGAPLRNFVAQALRVIQRNLVFHEAVFEDTQCGFKAFRREVFKSIAGKQLVEGGMYDLEYLYAATVRGLHVECVDVSVNPESRPSRINVWRCILFDPLEIARFRVAGALGRYRTGE
jgi:glycosyltransferase involved in cell wall biosynthesis